MSQVRIITLNEGEHLKSVVNRLMKEWTLHFVLGPTLMGHHVRLFASNLDRVDDDCKSHVNEFYELEWV
uniref:Uncharacterized protein n=1 Tax=Plectus sambesii TaxID=2011161 RepID=A0A914WNA1_9BILA